MPFNLAILIADGVFGKDTYADGKEISWSELVEGAEHPAASLKIVRPPLVSYGNLAFPISAIAFLAALASFFKRARTENEASRKSVVVLARN